MRQLSWVLPLGLLCAGCATAGAGSGGLSALSQDSALSAAPAVVPPDTTPRLVIPTAGAAPVLSIPLGGGLYQPLDGSPPTPGIPVSP